MNDAALREELVNLLTKRQAHMDFGEAVADFPEAAINVRVPNGEYTFWQLLEHMRITQQDILEYIEAETYTWPNWPDDYWPAREAMADAGGWAETIAQFEADRQRLVAIVMDPDVDLFAPLANSGERGHTILREIHVVASHNAYHTGELGILRGVMGYWK